MAKTALITGITGQDGAYLARLLLSKGYIVHGIKRRSSSFNTARIDGLYQDPHDANPKLFLHYGDLTDATNLIRIVQDVRPDEIYNLGAQSHVQVSFETPEYTANSDALGTLRLLEALRITKQTQSCRFYQASTMWRIVQHEHGDDFVLGTGKMYAVRDFVERAFAAADVTIEWSGQGVDEIGRDSKSGKTLVKIDPRYFRPTEVENLLADASKAKQLLGWEASTPFADLVAEMVAADLIEIPKEQHRNG